MTPKLCPIAWTKEDGPYPCAFKSKDRTCNVNNPDPWAPPCIPVYKKKYYHSLEGVPTKCPQCGKDTETARGDLARGRLPLCKDCSEERNEMGALAVHVRGDI